MIIFLTTTTGDEAGTIATAGTEGAKIHATVATAALVFALSIRLRRRELRTLEWIGASRGSVVTILLFEVAFVLGVAALSAALLTALAGRFAGEAIRSLLLS